MSKLRFVGKNGEFVSTFKRTKAGVPIGYLEELCEYIYYHDNKTKKKKKEEILALELMIKNFLKQLGINFIPTWSKKLK